MRAAARILTFLLAGAAAAPAHDPITTKLTWSAEISRIVYRHCAACHRDGGRAMSLLRYEEVRPWAKAIRDEVLSRRMPPWGAVAGFGEFRDDPSLTQEEIGQIAQWVEGGAPEGDKRYLPPVPVQESRLRRLPEGARTRKLHFATSRTLLAIRPLADVASAKVTAIRPDGTVEPLLWLLHFRSAPAAAFVYRAPVPLPAGSRIVSEPPVPLELITARAGVRAGSR